MIVTIITQERELIKQADVKRIVNAKGKLTLTLWTGEVVSIKIELVHSYAIDLE